MNRFQQIRASVYNSASKRPIPQKSAAGRSNQTSARAGQDSNYLHPVSAGSAATGSNGYAVNPHYRSSSNMPAAGSGPGTGAAYPSKYADSRLTFKPSPFYRIHAQLGRLYTLQGAYSSNTQVLSMILIWFPQVVMTQHRSTVSIPLKLSENPGMQLCLQDPSFRVMVFCAGSSSNDQDICFPYQAEIKVNGGDFKANLRGLKNKPGSTRPVDITNALRLKPTYVNSVDFTYALTQKASPQKTLHRAQADPRLALLLDSIRLSSRIHHKSCQRDIPSQNSKGGCDHRV